MRQHGTRRLWWKNNSNMCEWCRINSSRSGHSTAENYCNHENEIFVSIKDVEFIDHLADYFSIQSPLSPHTSAKKIRARYHENLWLVDGTTFSPLSVFHRLTRGLQFYLRRGNVPSVFETKAMNPVAICGLVSGLTLLC